MWIFFNPSRVCHTASYAFKHVASLGLHFRYLIVSPIIIMIWNVVFANKSRKLGWIWMKLGRWGWSLKRLSLARFQRNRAMGFGDSAKNGSQRRCFFCDVNDAPLLPLSLDRFPPIFPRTRVQVVARDTWFHIPEKFPLRDRICRKPSFKGTLFVISLRVTGNVLRRLHCFHPLVDIPQMCLSYRWLLLRDVPFSSYPPPKVSSSAMGIPGWGHSRATWRGAGHYSIGL